MANNTTLNVGSGGDVIATEDIGGVKYELVKAVFGPAGNATKVSASDPMPVTDNAAETLLSSIDGKLSGTLTVDTGLTQPTTPADTQPVSAASLPLPGGAATEAKQDTGNSSLASIDSKITSVNTGAVTISAALPAGTNAIGKLAANDGVDIGDVTINNTSIVTSEVSPTTVLNGKKTVTTAGTRVTLASSTTVKSVTIKALSTNTGIIYIGDSSVTSSNGFQLAAGESASMDISNLNTINIDSSVNGEGVTYLGVN